MIISRTPYRVSFFGGGTDYPTWFEKNGGAVLVSAIDKFCYVTLRYQPQFLEHKSRVVWSKVELVSSNSEIENPAVRSMLEYFNERDVGIEVVHQGDLPARSGMGSSSSFIVGLLNAHWELTQPSLIHDCSLTSGLERKARHKESLAKTAVTIEREVIGDTVGVQDQYAAALGGVNLLLIDKGGHVTRRECYHGPVTRLEENLMLVFLGFTRHASEIASAQVAEMDRHQSAMWLMTEQALYGYQILTNAAPMSDFADMLNEAWRLKRTLSPIISNSAIDRARDGLLANGADAGKIIGAGGGGFVLVYVRPTMRPGLIEWCRQSGLLPVPFRFNYSGSEIIFRELS